MISHKQTLRVTVNTTIHQELTLAAAEYSDEEDTITPEDLAAEIIESFAASRRLPAIALAHKPRKAYTLDAQDTRDLEVGQKFTESAGIDDSILRNLRGTGASAIDTFINDMIPIVEGLTSVDAEGTGLLSSLSLPTGRRY